MGEFKMGVPTVEPVSQRYWDDMRWSREHSTELHQRFGEDSLHGGCIWVAIYNKKVVGWGPDMTEAKRMAAEKTDAAPKEFPVKFIERGAPIYDQLAL